uniref:AT-hook motif nuclear-localized protein n=1 Tax=Musa acuminata subsp. malaccensis TaxID=214687 RepID=A0A804ID99_MUSAM|nr:PREDICTED: AT-hook motif nuclear-localized protein 10-like [Musa acuminata subsp. malaccensis]
MDGADSALSAYYSPHHHRGGGGATSSSARSPMFSAAPPSSASGASAAYAPPPAEPVRRKRGRPRKYGPPSPSPSRSSSQMINSPTLPVPSSSPTSPSAFARLRDGSSASPSSSKKAKLAAPGNAGHGFKTHVITVVAGEDVAQKIMSFVQHLEHTFCILAASGSISRASLSHPAVFGGCVTYEGRFEILSLSGSFVHNRTDGASMKMGGLSICLSGTDGRVVGGGVKGPLLAAEPVQVIAGSFMADSDGDFSDAKPAAASAGKLSTSVQSGLALNPATLGSSTECTGRFIRSKENDVHQNFAGSEINHVIQSPTDWTGRRDGGACQFFGDEEDENI